VVPENDTLLSVLGPTGIVEQNTSHVISLSATPHNNRFSIKYTLAKDDYLTLSIYDACGRQVRVLDNGLRQCGKYEIVWDCTDETKTPVSTGTYFVRLQAGNVELTRKVVLLD
jgi:flagellar hook assembly protein FlgD